MTHPSTVRRRLACVGVAAVALSLGLTPGGAAPAGAAAPQGYAASDVIGQTDAGGNAVFTTSGSDDNTASPNAKGVHYPQGSALDIAGHRLFVADCANNRVLIYDLDSENNMTSRSAAGVLGQPNLTANTGATTQGGLSCPVAPSYDAAHRRLFVVDHQNDRVLEFDLSAGVTNGMNASHVLGQGSFTTRTCPNPPTAASMCAPYGGSAYDAAHERLFVSDSSDDRVLVYDLDAGISDGMAASHVLGQPGFTSKSCAVTRSGLGFPYGAAYDDQRQVLYVADAGSCPTQGGRVMVWDLSSGISDGMNAAHVLGQATFTSVAANPDPRAAIDNPEDLAVDPARQHLYVQDENRSRVLVFNVASISDGEEASAVIGQPDFVTAVSYNVCAAVPPTRYDQCDAEGQSEGFDVANDRLYLSDSSYNRVLVFDFVEIDSALTPNGTEGVAYRAGIQSRAAQGTVSYAVTAGTLPPGLTLDRSSGLITGTPTNAGFYSFVVTVTDDNGVIGTLANSQADFILVSPIPVPASGGGGAG